MGLAEHAVLAQIDQVRVDQAVRLFRIRGAADMWRLKFLAFRHSPGGLWPSGFFSFYGSEAFRRSDPASIDSCA
jgi:hypothetical protein